MSLKLVTPDTLNANVEFDAPFCVARPMLDYGYAQVTDVSNVYAPTLYGEDIESSEWEFASESYTGQYGYNGPIMHASEQLSGQIALDILSTPGIYVVVVSEILDCEHCDNGQEDPECAGEHEPAGWAVLRYVG